MSNTNPITLLAALALLSLVPLIVVTMTSFLKMGVVLSILRNALGVQQIPPNMAIYALALMLTAYVMTPVGSQMVDIVSEQQTSLNDIHAMVETTRKASEPLRHFLVANSRPAQRDFFLNTARRLWPPKIAAAASPDDFFIVTPAFLVSELTSAFEIGFLLFLPFIVIDLVVSNILMAMGMMMVSPVTISLPLKLFLFVMIDGWSRLLHGLVQTYSL